jgi:hypothetical protein
MYIVCKLEGVHGKVRRASESWLETKIYMATASFLVCAQLQTLCRSWGCIEGLGWFSFHMTCKTHVPLAVRNHVP